MKKTTVDLILSIALFVGYFFTGLLALPFVAGVLFGDYLIAKYNWMGLRDDEEKEEEKQERKLALEKNQRKRKNLDLDKLKNPHHNDGGFVLKAGLEPARILLSIGF